MATREQIAAQAHNRRIHAEADRLIRELDQSLERNLRKCKEFEDRLASDPFRAINLRADSKGRFLSDPVDFDSGSTTLKIDSLADQNGELRHLETFSPRDFASPHVRVEPIDLLVCSWATLISFRIENFEVSRHLKLNLVKKSSPSESAVYLIDTEHDEYYYPLVTDIRGDIVAGHPKVGVVVFQPFRKGTASVSIHFSGVKLSPTRGSSDTFSFACEDEQMRKSIVGSLGDATLTNRVRALTDSKRAELTAQIEATRVGSLREMPKAGCLVALALLPVHLLIRF